MRISEEGFSNIEATKDNLTHYQNLRKNIPLKSNSNEEYEELNKIISDLCLNEIFEYHVDRNPQSPAIITEKKYLSYGEIESKANQIAHVLKQNGIGPGSFVGIYFYRSEKPIISILGILKAGAAYIPLDPAYPEERIKYILDLANISLLLTEDTLQENTRHYFKGKVISFDDHDSIIAKAPTLRLTRTETGHSNKNLCYVLFTSGTTGRPKGIMVEHRNVARFMKSFNQCCEITTLDRIYQGFSLGFDGSVEEIWMTFGRGATLVIAPPEIAQLGEETGDFMNKMKVTIFSTVPTFLSLIKKDLTSNRLIIVSGEPCPPQLVKIWSTKNRRMLNVYGPTETTVNTTVKDCLPNEEITIGTPLKGYDTYILDQSLNLVADGTAGELYIGGVGVARGYFKSPELTQKNFLPNPFKTGTTFYKTGDLVKKIGNEIHFISRIDTQVKIRGFRIELAEIESVLCDYPTVDSAVVNVHERNGQKKIAAYVLSSNDKEKFDYVGIRNHLKDRLLHYMIPSYLDVLETFPRLSSGKVNRKTLPIPLKPLVDSSREIIPPTNKYETNLLGAWKHILGDQEISTTDDFFINLGGDSLSAVEMVSYIKKTFKYNISIRDVYNNLTIKKLALKVIEKEKKQENDNKLKEKSKDIPKTPSAKEVFSQTPLLTRLSCYMAQALFLVILYTVPTSLFIGLIWYMTNYISSPNLLTLNLSVGFALFFLGYPLTVIFSVAFKWLVIGKYKAGRYPLWSFYYLRFWMVSKVQAMCMPGALSGTPLINLYCRLMGAKIGKNTILDTSLQSIHDLIEIGSNTSIQAGTQTLGYKIVDGMLILGNVKIGDNCYIGSHSCLDINTKMEDGSCLDDLSLVPENTTLKANTSYKGSPAKKEPISLSQYDKNATQIKRPFFTGLTYLLTMNFMSLFFLGLSIPPIYSIYLGYVYQGTLGSLLMIVLWSILNTVVFCLAIAAIKFIIMRKAKEGVYKINSFYYYRKWIVDSLMATGRVAVHSLYTTIYFPSWLRLLGAKIGKRAEISTVNRMSPDLTTIGDESFFADGSMVGGRRVHKGQVQVLSNKIGKRSFIGNNAMLPPGKKFGDNCLLGVLSVPPNTKDNYITDETEWLGSPSFRLPHRNKVTHFDKSETFNPTLKLYALRCLIDGMRIFIPNFIGLTSFALFMAYLFYAFNNLPLINIFALTPLVVLALTLAVALSVVLTKKIFMGSFKPVIKPLWSVYVWCNELVNGVYETIGSPVMAPFMGTPFYNWYLRLMGCKIGKNCYIGSSLFSEFDLVQIGDYVTLNAGVIVQNHLFEDRVMKSSYLKIGDECSIGNMSVILYDSDIGEKTKIAPLSLVMKGDQIAKETTWMGIPISDQF